MSVVTETTGSVSGISITSELNDELNDLIQRFHNQLHDSQVTHGHIHTAGHIQTRQLDIVTALLPQGRKLNSHQAQIP